MNSPELSLKVFAGYLLAVGSLLIAVPNVFLSLFLLPPASPDIWLRVLGLGPAQLLLFGLVDLLCALWTRQALKVLKAAA